MNYFKDHRTKFINDGVHIEGTRQIIDIPRMNTKKEMRDVYHKRRVGFAVGLLTLAALTAGSIDRALANDGIACTEMSASDDKSAQHAALDLRNQGAFVPNYQELGYAYTDAAESNTEEEYPTESICYTFRTGFTGELLDTLNNPEPVVGRQADELQSQI